MNGFQLKFFISKPKSSYGPTARSFEMHRFMFACLFFQIKNITYSSFGTVKKMLEYAAFK